MSAGPKRHHHLPQVIQRAFLEEGKDKLWWYSRSDDRYEERTPYGIGHARNTYTLTDIDGAERYKLERAFASLENKVGPAFKKLRAGYGLSQQEHNSIAEFVGFQYFRSPTKIALIQKLRELHGARELTALQMKIERMSVEEFRAYSADQSPLSDGVGALNQGQLVYALKNNPPRVTSTKEGTLGSLVDVGTDQALEFSRRSWLILHAPNNASFITSSEGMFLFATQPIPPTQVKPTPSELAAVFPFSRSAALIIEPHGPIVVQHARMDRATIRDFNDSLARVSSEIYGSPRPLFESIVKRTGLVGTGLDANIDDARIRSVFAKYAVTNQSG